MPPKTAATPKLSTAVPVRVRVDRQLPPVSRPPVDLNPSTPKAKTSPLPVVSKTVRALRQPVHAWPEAKRRKLMWWLVSGGAAVLFIGWLAVLQLEMHSGSTGQNLLTDIYHKITSLRFPGQEPVSAAEQEVRDLDSQIFPQFQQ
ncbi:MAG: hypothetical protein HY975_00555 [Candidatus Kerfeldbacteria bacterium]|nr:hypothetical protein [Candidatus Kerfeldbacteria bacterium]